MLEASLDKLLVMVKDEKDRQVVMVIMEAIAEMLNKAKGTVLAKPGRLDELMAMVKLVILEKVGNVNVVLSDLPFYFVSV